MTKLEVLVKARALLVERGWHQGDMVGPGGCLCAVGACKLASEDGGDINSRWLPSADAAVSALEWAAGIDGYQVDVPDWQDRPGRTLDEVLAVFDRAIEASR